MTDLSKCSKPNCNNLAVAVANGWCFKHIKISLFGGVD